MASQLKLIKSNTIRNAGLKMNIQKKDKLFCETDQIKIITDKFFSQMDQGLSIILNSCPLPVFVMGCQKLLKVFKKLTKNEQSITQFIHGNHGMLLRLN